MPSSKKRKHHHPHHSQEASAIITKGSSKMNERIVTAGIVFFAVIGLGIAFFAAGGNMLWVIAGAVIGGIAGYFFGKALKKGLLKG
jgi:sterol desaturase/sphingolipid hydroxylase (fatty acid hydroxylase superfamily)